LPLYRPVSHKIGKWAFFFKNRSKGLIWPNLATQKISIYYRAIEYQFLKATLSENTPPKGEGFRRAKIFCLKIRKKIIAKGRRIQDGEKNHILKATLLVLIATALPCLWLLFYYRAIEYHPLIY